MIQGVSTVTDVLKKIASAMTGISMLAIFAGMREVTGYYTTFGAPWIIQLFSPVQLIQKSIDLLFIMGVVACIAIILFTDRDVSVEGLRRWNFYIVIGACVPSLVLLGLQYWIEVVARYAWSIPYVISWVFAISAGLSLGEFIARVSDKNFEWRSFHLNILLNGILIFGFSSAPYEMGMARAKMDANPQSSSLPVVSLQHTEASSGEWRLIQVIDDKFLVVRLAADKEDRIFRLVGPEDIRWVHVPKSKSVQLF